MPTLLNGLSLKNPITDEQADPSLGSSQEVSFQNSGAGQGIAAAGMIAGQMNGGGGQKSVLASGAQGAAAGAALGGPGALVGAGIGVIGAMAGNEAARRKEAREAQRNSLLKQSEIYQNNGRDQAAQLSGIMNSLRSSFLRG